jgi:hypothetical protein
LCLPRLEEAFLPFLRELVLEMKGRHGYLPYNRGLKHALVAKLQYDNDIYDQGEEFWLNLGFQKDNFL